jgi:peptide/nickel transport system substrate-binding protein
MRTLGAVNGLPSRRPGSFMAGTWSAISRPGLRRTDMADQMRPAVSGRLRPRRLRISRRAALVSLLSGGVALGLAACAPTPPRTDQKPGAAAKPAEAPKPTEAPKPAEAAKPAAPAQAAAPKPTTAAPPAATGQTGGQLRVGLNSELTTLDPHLSTTAVDRQVYQSLYDSLVRLGPDLSIKPGLAESWTQPDPKTIVFKLRSGIKYHDGESFNAASVKANFERMMNHPKSLRKGEISDIASVDAVDELTVKLNLSQPSAPLLSLLTDRAGMMVSVKAADAAGDDFARKPVGTGPFSFVEWMKDDHLTVRKNPSFWEKDPNGTQLPYLDEVVYKPIPDGNQRLTALKTNTVDILDSVNAKDVPALRGSQDLKVSEVPGLGYRYIWLNVKRPPLDNKMIRQAIAYAIDRETIQKVVLVGVGQVAYQGIPPTSFAFDPDFKPYSPRDVEKAKALVAQSGVKDPKFPTLVTTSPEDRQLSEVYKEQLADAGITMEIEVVESTILTDRSSKKDYVSAISSWSGRADPDGNVANLFTTKGAQNRSDYQNARVDELLQQARATTAPAERKQLYSQANTIILDDMPLLPIQHLPEVKAMSPKLQGFVHVPDGMIRTVTISLQR